MIARDNTPQLLDDASIRQFLTDGSIQVRAEFPDDVHGRLYGGLEKSFVTGNPGNNILPQLPELAAVYEHPAVRGALTSLLGPGYFMHPHRYCHLNSPGTSNQDWHKDDYIYDWNVRHHRFRWVMAFYYPQDVTDDMGPTSTMPGRQHHNSISDPDPQKATEDVCLHSGPAGRYAHPGVPVGGKSCPPRPRTCSPARRPPRRGRASRNRRRGSRPASG